MTTTARIWLVLGWAGFALLPWHLLSDANWYDWVVGHSAQGARTALGLAWSGGAWWLAPIALPLLIATWPMIRYGREQASGILTSAGIGGLALVVIQGFAIGLGGWNWSILADLLGTEGPSQAGMGLGAGLTLIGKDLILLLLGPGWETSGRIFTFFGPGIGIMLLYGTHGWIHLSIGRADRWLRWGIVELAVTGLCFLIGLSGGPVGIALAWVVSFWILTIPGLWYAGKPVGLEVGPMVGVVWRYVLASALAAIASTVVVRELPSVLAASGVSGALARIAVNASLFGGFYLAAVILLHMGCEPLWRIAELLGEMVPSRRVHQSRAVVVSPAAADGV